MDNCVGGLFNVADISRRASVFVINWYRSRTSESIFGVKFLFGSKALRNSSSKDIELAQKVKTERQFSCDKSRAVKYIEWLTLILAATFRLRLLQSHSLKHERQPHLVTDTAWLSWEWCAQWEKSAGQPCGHIPIRRNQPRKFEAVMLYWVVTNGRNSKRQVSRISRLHWACCLS
jgi:hypothetical protein